MRYQLDVCVGANTVRPSKKQTHGNNKVRQQKILPDNSEFTANPEHGRTLFAPTDYSGEFVMPQNRCARCLCTTLISYAHSSFLIYPCFICHTPLLSSPISPPKYHQAYQSFPISTSNLFPLLTVYSFWLYRQG